MSITKQRDKIKVILPYIKQKTGIDLPDEAIKASRYDKHKVAAIIDRPRHMQAQAIEIMLANLGVTEEEDTACTLVTDAGFAQDVEADLQKLCRIYRRLDALTIIASTPGYFKALPLIDTLGHELAVASMELVTKFIDPVELMRLKREGIL